MNADITLVLSEPPSANALWRNVVIGRSARTLKAKPYREWLTKAADEVAQQSAADRLDGPYSLRITVPKQKRRDLANNEKALSDLLQAAGVVKDDLNCVRLTMVRDPSREPGRVLVELWAA